MKAAPFLMSWKLKGNSMAKSKPPAPPIAYKHYGEIPIIEFKALQSLGGLRHGCTTRLGGISQGCFASLNLGFKTGDDSSRIRENYRRLAAALAIPEEAFTLSRQNHTVNILAVRAEDRGKGLCRPGDKQDIDGLITNEPGICLLIHHGDCVPLLIADKHGKAIAAVHAGWRGTAGNIAGHGVAALQKSYGIEPADLIAAIGPSIGSCCYEIGPEVAAAFAPLEGSRDFLFPLAGDKFHLDLPEVNRRAFLAAGLKEENIHLSGLCTACHKRIFFSHRRQKGRRGLQGSFIMLED